MNHLWEFDCYRVDFERRLLLRGDEPVQLPAKALDALLALIQRRGKVVTKDELMKAVWPDAFVEEGNLSQSIHVLRRALGESIEEHRYIVTVPGLGYRFVADVREIPEIKDDPTPKPDPIAKQGYRFAAHVEGSSSPPASSLRSRIMLAVLPFEDMSSQEGQEYFSDGLTEEMITQLGRMNPDRLGVIARTSAMHYKNCDKTVQEIGRELGVSYVLEGSVRRAGRRVRVTALLIRVADQTHLWSESYDRDLGNILALQSDLARAIADEIRIKLTPQERARLGSVRPVNPEAYEAYLKGRYHWSRGSRGSLSKAIQYFNDAIRLDPSYAPAYTGLADAYSDLAAFNFQPPAEAFPKAKAAALKAIEIDSNLAEAHGALASVAWAYDWDSVGAEKGYEKAFELNPVSASTHLRYATYLANMGRFDGAISEVRRAHELDPLSPLVTATVGWVYMLARRYDEALGWYNKGLELEPNVGALTRADIAWTYALKGAHTEAIAEYEKLPHRPTPAENQAVAGGLGFLLAVSGRRREALDIIAQFKKLSATKYIDGCMVASIYAGLGDKDHAFDWLAKAYEGRSSSMVFLKVDPFFDGLRSDPRYADLVRRIGLPQ